MKEMYLDIIFYKYLNITIVIIIIMICAVQSIIQMGITNYKRLMF